MRFCDRLKVQRKLKGFTQEHVAKCLSLTKSAVSRWETGHSIPDGELLHGLSDLLEVKAEWLLSGDEINSSNTVTLVDFYSDVLASAGNGHLNNDESTEKYPMPKNIVDYEGVSNICCIKTSGKSMMPVLADGSIVALNTSKKTIRDGMMYVIRQGDLLRVKILIEKPKKIIIRSYNTEFEDEEFIKNDEYNDDFVIVGQVVWHSSYLEKM